MAEESNWKKFKAWVSDGTTSVYTKENMNAIKMGINNFLITAILVAGFFVFSWARKIENELHSIGVMQLWSSFGVLLGIVIGVYRLILLMIYDVDNYIVESLMWGCLGTFFILKGIFMNENKFLRLANIGVAILAYWVILKKFLM